MSKRIVAGRLVLESVVIIASILAAFAEGRRAERSIPVDNGVNGVYHLRHSLLTHGTEEVDPLIQVVDSILGLIERSR